ncbi:His Kinase A (phospho-acceptor) domain-containing protein [Desulfuromusa kysingii]|uniref:histidine kinase n=1 Tax=Desulfuromusa kysingii TaxID=37625 RepID=A0A1H4C3S5_9BACT|nr:response regulator [Desulfuromusa kysingii]SEA54987.1 His Kinase A (phospho-acceptor) domain-containing protein [Desulfuromusa kysingii]
MTEKSLTPAILLIDDAPLILDLLEDILEPLEYPVLRSESGSGITKMLDQEKVAVVFCDVSLPDIHGVNVLRMIKQHTPEIQVIMISGQQDFDVARQVLRERALDYLVKPFSQEEVLQAAKLGISSYFQAVHQNESRLEAQRRMADLILLKKVGETASSGNGLQELFDQILDSIVHSTGVDVASLMLLKDDGMLHIAAAHGLTPEIVGSVKVASGEGISGHVLATGEAVLVPNIDQDGRFKRLEGGLRYKNQSLLSVPIYVRDEFVGVINVNNKKSGEPFDLEDQNLLVAIANQVSLAMENFELVNNLRQQALELERTNEDLVRVNRARTRLVCNLSHELKTPLTSIMGYIDLSLTFFNKLSEEEVKDNLLQVHGEGKRLERLITGMLRLFSIESEREVWRWKSFGVPWSIADSFQYFNSKMNERNLVAEINIQDDLPEIYGDQEKFGMAFNSLIDNAVKFNRDGGRVKITATVEELEGLEYVHLQVFNDGQTVPIKAHETIFDSYTQLGDIDTEKPHGVGIGLALVKVVVDRMRGDIFLEEVTDEGTCFGLMLPTENTYNRLLNC